MTRLNIKPVFTCNLQKARILKLVAPYKLTIIETSLDDNWKYIESGGKDNKFFTTEKKQYGYMEKRLKDALYHSSKQVYNFRVRDRMRFIYNLKSKQLAAKYIIDNILPAGKKYLIFCGSTKVADELCEYRFHTKNKKHNKEHFKLFEAGIITRLSCVNALNEGINISFIDGELLVQFNATDRATIQRIGRAIRYRKNHVADILIICCKGTQDEEWLEDALEEFDEEDITRISYSNFILGI